MIDLFYRDLFFFLSKFCRFAYIENRDYSSCHVILLQNLATSCSGRDGIRRNVEPLFPTASLQLLPCRQIVATLVPFVMLGKVHVPCHVCDVDLTLNLSVERKV
jgi:hypothetical protein